MPIVFCLRFHSEWTTDDGRLSLSRVVGLLNAKLVFPLCAENV